MLLNTGGLKVAERLNLVSSGSKMATSVVNSSAATAVAFSVCTARTCDVCANKNAQWFCSADDAYLCTACDTQVHSANALSRRHERIHLPAHGMRTQSHATGFQVPAEGQCGAYIMKRLHPHPEQVLPSRKRSRVSKPYSHHLRKLTRMVSKDLIKSEDLVAINAEAKLFDFLNTDEVLHGGNQEVPSLSIVMGADAACSPDIDLLSSDYKFQGNDHSASADSFAAFFKGKAAPSQTLFDDSDQFLVPDAFNFRFDVEISDPSTTPADAIIGLSSEEFFHSGDIPGLDGFESFVPDLSVPGNFGLNLDQELHNGVQAPSQPTEPASLGCKRNLAAPDHTTAGPFAKFFAQKPKSESQELISHDEIKREAKEMLKCCREGDGDAQMVPTLKLNLEDVLAAWSDKGEPWISSDESTSSGSDVGLVPDMHFSTADDNQSGGGRDAKVLRYKEKRATRLFSKKIRYEVRKVNAERRPRMKGRFVKRTSSNS